VGLYGMPGGDSSPSWVKMTASAKKGQKNIIVGGGVHKVWPRGSYIAIASTDYDYAAVDSAKITGCEP